jgi:hypothetical protein
MKKKFTELCVGDLISLNPSICSVNPSNAIREVIKAPELLSGDTWVAWVSGFGRYYGKPETLIAVHN